MARNDPQRASVSTPINIFLYLFAYFICGVELPTLWMIVTEAIYDLRESQNCAWTFDTYFMTSLKQHMEYFHFRGQIQLDLPVLLGVPVALPSGCRGRGLEAEVADRRFGEGDAVEGDEGGAIAGSLLFAGYFT